MNTAVVMGVGISVILALSCLLIAWVLRSRDEYIYHSSAWAWVMLSAVCVIFAVGIGLIPTAERMIKRSTQTQQVTIENPLPK